MIDYTGIMTGTQKTAVVIALILSATAYLVSGQYFECKAKVEAVAQTEATKRELISLDQKFVSAFSDRNNLPTLAR